MDLDGLADIKNPPGVSYVLLIANVQSTDKVLVLIIT